MKPITPDTSFSGVEVTNINRHGLWLLTNDHELFISFNEFPRFRDAPLSHIMRVERLTAGMLHWPHLGMVLPVGSVRCFPLVPSKPRPTTRLGRQAKTGPIAQSKNDLRSTPVRTQG